MLKIDKITNFSFVGKLQNTIRFFIFKHQHLCNIKIFAKDKKSNYGPAATCPLQLYLRAKKVCGSVCTRAEALRRCLYALFARTAD